MAEAEMPVKVDVEITGFNANLKAALAKAQTEIFNPGKNRTVDVVTKSGGTFSYDYAELNVVTEICRGPCARNGLSFSQHPELKGDRWYVITTLMHSSGEQCEYSYPLIITESDRMKKEQSFASGFTYAKRQALKGIFAIADDTEDKDGQDDPPPNAKSATVSSKQQTNAQPKPQPRAVAKVSTADIDPFPPVDQNEPYGPLDELYALADERAIPKDEMLKIMKQICKGKTKSTDLTLEEIDTLIKYIKLMPRKQTGESQEGT